MDISEVIAARKELVELGVLEDSGERRADQAGVMQVVWRVSTLGKLVGDYRSGSDSPLKRA